MAVYKTMQDVYPRLKELTAVRGVAARMGLTGAGLQFKCLRSQFFTAGERDKFISALESIRKGLDELIKVVRDLPVKK